MKNRLLLVFLALTLVVSPVVFGGCPAPVPVKELTVTEIIFCSEEPGARDYKVQPDATYKSNFGVIG